MAPREFRFRCHVDSPHTSHVCTWCFGPSTEDESDFTKANPSRCSFDLRGPSVNPKFETRMRLEWTEQRENRHRDSNGAWAGHRDSNGVITGLDDEENLPFLQAARQLGAPAELTLQLSAAVVAWLWWLIDGDWLMLCEVQAFLGGNSVFWVVFLLACFPFGSFKVCFGPWPNGWVIDRYNTSRRGEVCRFDGIPNPPNLPTGWCTVREPIWKYHWKNRNNRRRNIIILLLFFWCDTWFCLERHMVLLTKENHWLESDSRCFPIFSFCYGIGRPTRRQVDLPRVFRCSGTVDVLRIGKSGIIQNMNLMNQDSWKRMGQPNWFADMNR